MEHWKIVNGFEEYMISDCGRVKSFKNGNEVFLKPRVSRDGYLRVALRQGGKSKEFRVHVLVMKEFSNCIPKETINHIDGVKTNNNIENLEYATRSENMKHAYSMGLKKRVMSACILSDEQVKEIRSIYIPKHKEYGMGALAKKYNVSNSTIDKLVRGKTYKHLL